MLAGLEVAFLSWWAEFSVPTIFAVHISEVENWQADYLSTGVGPQKLSLHRNVFHQICLQWGTHEVDLLTFRLNRKGTEVCGQVTGSSGRRSSSPMGPVLSDILLATSQVSAMAFA